MKFFHILLLIVCMAALPCQLTAQKFCITDDNREDIKWYEEEEAMGSDALGRWVCFEGSDYEYYYPPVDIPVVILAWSRGKQDLFLGKVNDDGCWEFNVEPLEIEGIIKWMLAPVDAPQDNCSTG